MGVARIPRSQHSINYTLEFLVFLAAIKMSHKNIQAILENRLRQFPVGSNRTAGCWVETHPVKTLDV